MTGQNPPQSLSKSQAPRYKHQTNFNNSKGKSDKVRVTAYELQVLAIGIFAVSNVQNKNQLFIKIDSVEKAVITDPVAIN